MKTACFLVILHLASAGRQPDKLGKCKAAPGRIEPGDRFWDEPQATTASPDTWQKAQSAAAQALLEKEKALPHGAPPSPPPGGDEPPKRPLPPGMPKQQSAAAALGSSPHSPTHGVQALHQEEKEKEQEKRPGLSHLKPNIPARRISHNGEQEMQTLLEVNGSDKGANHNGSNHSIDSLFQQDQVAKSKKKLLLTQNGGAHPKIADKDPEENKHGENLAWDELDENAQKGWETLGYNKDMWDDEYAVPAAMDMDWAELDEGQKEAAENLGYTQSEWDQGEEWFAKGGKKSGKHGEELAWDELHKVARTHWKTFGYNKEIWDGETVVPDAINKPWSELTPEQQNAATNLGYTQQSWDAGEEWKARAGAVLSPSGIFVTMMMAVAVAENSVSELLL